MGHKFPVKSKIYDGQAAMHFSSELIHLPGHQPTVFSVPTIQISKTKQVEVLQAEL